MSRPAYSSVLAYEPSVTGTQAVAATNSNQVFVVRTMMATFGSYLGQVDAALGLDPEGPWSILCSSAELKLAGVSKTTFIWEGRYVVPRSTDLYVQVSEGDTCDVKLDGYILSYDGS